jgi:hypothetical protein
MSVISRSKEMTMQELRPEPELDSGSSGRPVVTDAVRVQILATEHWSLLATRSMIWNELFTRTSMFVTVLSASMVALALVAQATDFDDTFRLFALLVLPVTLVIGIGTFIRLGDAMSEDIWLVMGMNRLRHGYLDLAPDLEPYFLTGFHDDIASILQTRGPRPHMGPSRILSSTPTIVAIIDSVLAGVIGALLAGMVYDHPAVTIGVGLTTATAVAVVMVGVVPRREISRFMGSLTPRFPQTAALNIPEAT